MLEWVNQETKDYYMKLKDKKYVTLREGTDFRHIAKVMSAKGYKMNHATARNQLMQAIETLLNYTASDLGLTLSKDELTELAKSQEVHDALQDVLYLANKGDVTKVVKKD